MHRSRWNWQIIIFAHFQKSSGAQGFFVFFQRSKECLLLMMYLFWLGPMFIQMPKMVGNILNSSINSKMISKGDFNNPIIYFNSRLYNAGVPF